MSQKSRSRSDERTFRQNPLLVKVEPMQQSLKEQSQSKPASTTTPGQPTTAEPEPIKATIDASKEKSYSVGSIPLTTHFNARNRLVSRQKYVGNHFSDNRSALLREVKMAPRPVAVHSSTSSSVSNIQKTIASHVIKETPLKNPKRTERVRSPARSQKTEDIKSPCFVDKKDPSNLVAAVMKLRSKPK